VFSWKQNKTKNVNCSANSETHNQLWFPHKLDGVSIFINQLLHIVLLASWTLHKAINSEFSLACSFLIGEKRAEMCACHHT